MIHSRYALISPVIAILFFLSINAEARKCRIRSQPALATCNVPEGTDSIEQSVSQFKDILRAWNAESAKRLASNKQASSKDVEEALSFEQSLEEIDLPYCDEILAENILRPKNAKSDLKLYLNGTNNGKTCGYLEVLSESMLDTNGDISKSLKKMNWDPCCVPSDIKTLLSQAQEHVAGFMVGVEAGASIPGLAVIGPGANIGREVVFLRTGPDSLQVAVVKYDGLATSISLPAGASVTRGMLYGDCLKMSDYLGYFKTFTVGGVHLENVGMSSHPYDLTATRTNCNSKSYTTGATAALVGIEGTYYEMGSKIVEVKGPQIRALLDMIDRADRVALNKSRQLPDQQKIYSEDRFKKAECTDNLLIQAGDQGISGVAELIKKNAKPASKKDTSEQL